MICLYFPRLNVELACRRRPALRGRPLALVQGAGDDAVIVGRSPEAACRGVIVGTRAGEARRRVPDLAFAAANRDLARAELGRIAGELSDAIGSPVSIGDDCLTIPVGGGPLDRGTGAYLAELAALTADHSDLSCVAGSGASAEDARAAAMGAARRIAAPRAQAS